MYLFGLLHFVEHRPTILGVSSNDSTASNVSSIKDALSLTLQCVQKTRHSLS
jgi:hypothetical protein